jgi:SAM-dependent methyltransferase
MGMTGHPGGLAGTRKLLSRLDIRQGERALDLGCGTGYTTTLIAWKSAEAVATDLRPGMLALAKERAVHKGVMDRVLLVAGDAQRLPFRDNTFDAAIVESVLVFCDVPAALRELFRVLKPGGRLGCNEATFLRPVPREKADRISAYFGFRLAAMAAEEWTCAFGEAGFEDVKAEARAIDWLDATLLTPIRIYGVGGYLSALWKSVADPKVRRARWKRSNLIGLRLLRDMGSGLYWARKPG